MANLVFGGVDLAKKKSKKNNHNKPTVIYFDLIMFVDKSCLFLRDDYRCGPIDFVTGPQKKTVINWSDLHPFEMPSRWHLKKPTDLSMTS
jgi:hypothetical protein